MTHLVALLAAAAAALPSAAGLSPRPPLGWSSWNRFGCEIDEGVVRETADALVASGMRDAGYRFVNVDDCWMARSRGGQGELQADPDRFPSGMEALADFVHARGLRFGLYTSIGAQTCQGRPALAGHEAADVKQLTGWGIDYLKVDFCGASAATRRDPEPAFRRVRDLLDASGRRVILSIATWGRGEPWRWRHGTGQLWRVSGDIRPEWDWIVRIAQRSNLRRRFAGPGGWNDPDMLEVGNRPLTARESRAHLALWAMLAAPLIAGNDVRRMDRRTRRTLLNAGVLAIDQDALGRQGRRLRGGSRQIWVRRLRRGARAVLFLNRARGRTAFRFDLRDAGLPGARAYRVRDLWRERSRRSGRVLRASVRGHDARIFRVRRPR